MDTRGYFLLDSSCCENEKVHNNECICAYTQELFFVYRVLLVLKSLWLITGNFLCISKKILPN